jgi:hypothetical protein
MKLTLMLLTGLMLVGCCPESQTIISDRVDTLYVPIYADSDTVLIFRADSAWTGESPKYIVRVDTLIKKVYLYRKPDTVKVYYEWKDTVQFVPPKQPDESSWLERQIWKLIVIVLCLAGAVIIVRKAFGI